MNYDTVTSHVIHGVSPIPHGPVADPLDPAPAPGLPGESYEVVIDTASLSDLLGGYYCHNHESGANLRVVRFNVDP